MGSKRWQSGRAFALWFDCLPLDAATPLANYCIVQLRMYQGESEKHKPGWWVGGWVGQAPWIAVCTGNGTGTTNKMST